MKHLLFIISIFIFYSCKYEKPKSIFEDIFENSSDNFKAVISEKDKFEIQILFSPISRQKDSIKVEDHFFNFRPDDYFYPASSVKMPVAFLALQKLEELRSAGLEIDRNTPLTIDSLRTPQQPVMKDTTSSNEFASIAHYINKLFVVSDNDAYNRLYEFTSQDYINSHLHNKGIFTNSRIVHRVGINGFSFEENKWSPPINFLDQDGEVFHTRQPSYSSGFWLTPISKTKKGKGYIDSLGNIVPKPFDFYKKNFVNIKDLQESLKRIILPSLYPKSLLYNLSIEDREFVIESMEKLPKDYIYLQKDKEDYYDSYVKFFLFGDTKDSIPDHIKIKNKVGYAYGYLTDCAHINDTKHNIEYFLTATIHVNDNQIYNDGIYEYDELGIPFLAELGRLVHQYMINKKNDEKI